jgi:hypothetical protein
VGTAVGLKQGVARQPHDGFCKRAALMMAVETVSFPPFGAVTGPVNLSVVHAAERDRKLVADLATERTGLHEPKVVEVRRLPAEVKAGARRRQAPLHKRGTTATVRRQYCGVPPARLGSTVRSGSSRRASGVANQGGLP